MNKPRHLLFGLLLALTALFGCEGALENDGMRVANRMLDAMEGLSDMMASIKDAESARAAMPNVEAVFTEYTDALKAVGSYERKNGQIRGTKADINRLKNGLANGTKDLEVHGRRLSRIKGLPEDFWEVYRTQQANFLVNIIESAPGPRNRSNEAIDKLYLMRNLFVEHGPSKTVEIAMGGFTFRSGSKATIEKLSSLLESEATIIEVENPDDPSGKILVIGPTDKYDELLTLTRELGNVTFEDRPRRIIEFTIDSSKDPDSRQRLAGRQKSTFENMESMRDRARSPSGSSAPSRVLSKTRADKLD
ncbi:MAG: hypothetical protein AAF497_19530, partial [Planctomycetota bacterium]